jgi:hypothetical protein
MRCRCGRFRSLITSTSDIHTHTTHAFHTLRKPSAMPAGAASGTRENKAYCLPGFFFCCFWIIPRCCGFLKIRKGSAGHGTATLTLVLPKRVFQQIVYHLAAAPDFTLASPANVLMCLMSSFRLALSQCQNVKSQRSPTAPNLGAAVTVMVIIKPDLARLPTELTV